MKKIVRLIYLSYGDTFYASEKKYRLCKIDYSNCLDVDVGYLYAICIDGPENTIKIFNLYDTVRIDSPVVNLDEEVYKL